MLQLLLDCKFQGNPENRRNFEACSAILMQVGKMHEDATYSSLLDCQDFLQRFEKLPSVRNLNPYEKLVMKEEPDILWMLKEAGAFLHEITALRHRLAAASGMLRPKATT